MDYLVDIYTKKPELLDKLFDAPVNISVKVDGSAFQISNQDGEIKFHKRSGSSSRLGPVVDEYIQAFAGYLNKAIDYFSKFNFDDYKFLAIEILESKYVLLNVIDKNDNIISSGPELDKIADSFGIYSVPLLFDGKLLDDMKTKLIDMCTLSEDVTNEDFQKLILDIFKVENKKYKELLKSEEIEGIVLTWNLGGKIAQYKIINPVFKKRHTAETEAQKEKAEKNANELQDLITLLADKLDTDGEKLDDNRLKSLELNFIKFIGDPKFLNKLINTAAKVNPNDSKMFFLQIDRLSDTMKALVKKHGTPLVTAYEQLLMVFNKERKRNYIISKEFQTRINSIVNKI